MKLPRPLNKVLPSIPNLPFFYLVFRAWSHWRAIAGGKHIKWLVDNKLLQPSPSQTLDQLYETDGPTDPLATTTDEATATGKEKMLLTQKQVRAFSETLDLPPLALELERAIWQVEEAIQKEETESGSTNSKEADASDKTEKSKKDA